MRIRARRHRAARITSPTWQDNMPDRAAGSRDTRYMSFTQIDRWRAIGYAIPPDPEHGTVLQRVRQMTEALGGAVDEGTGPALDLIVEAWIARWIAKVETDYTDHCGVISVHRNQAEQWLAETIRLAQHENQELERSREAYLACRARLAGEPAAQPGGSARAFAAPDDAGPGKGARP